MSAATTHGVLVTAGGSPLTQAVAQRLASSAEVHATVVVHQPGTELPREHTPGIEHVHADLTRHRDVQNLLQGIARSARLDIILHSCLRPEPRDHGSQVFRLNVESTRHLLAVAESEPHVERFVLRSFHEIYRLERDSPTLIDETQPLELSARTPQVARNLAEADLMVCARMAVSRLRIAVLRCADVLAPRVSSQLYDYLSSKLCLRPLGYDPMVNVLSLSDAARALQLAALSDTVGIFNIPGKDSMPLSELIHHAGRLGLSLPGPLLTPLYDLRAQLTRGRFSYTMDRARFHHGVVLDGSKARDQLDFRPEAGVTFPIH